MKFSTICKPGERYCLDCIRKDKKPNKKEKKLPFLLDYYRLQF